MTSLSCYYKMSLNGRGIVKVKPDIAIVLMGVVTENKSLKIAQEENSLKVSKVIQGLNNSGIPNRDIKTERYYNIALERAIKQAVSKAEAIRSSSRIMLNTTPISIIEESSNYLPIYGTKLSSAAINTPISPGEIEIAANIKAIFQYVQY